MSNDMHEYCNTWHLTNNTNKTKFMVFERGRHSHPKIYLNGIELDVVSSFKYLGVEILKNGNWSRTQKHISHHASYALFRLYNLFNQIALKIHENYNCLTHWWGPSSTTHWSFGVTTKHQILNTFICKILGVRKSTNLEALYGETGRYPMKIV